MTWKRFTKRRKSAAQRLAHALAWEPSPPGFVHIASFGRRQGKSILAAVMHGEIGSVENVRFINGSTLKFQGR